MPLIMQLILPILSCLSKKNPINPTGLGFFKKPRVFLNPGFGAKNWTKIEKLESPKSPEICVNTF